MCLRHSCTNTVVYGSQRVEQVAAEPSRGFGATPARSSPPLRYNVYNVQRSTHESAPVTESTRTVRGSLWRRRIVSLRDCVDCESLRGLGVSTKDAREGMYVLVRSHVWRGRCVVFAARARGERGQPRDQGLPERGVCGAVGRVKE